MKAKTLTSGFLVILSMGAFGQGQSREVSAIGTTLSEKTGVVSMPKQAVAAQVDTTPVALVVASKEATLSSQMAGRINRLQYEMGDAFPAGAVLAEFDCAEPKAKLDALVAENAGARETHLAKLRLQGLGAAGDLEVTLAAATAERAKSQVKQQEAQMAYCKIIAPYPGRIVRLRAKTAETVVTGQPVLEIVAATQLKALLHMPLAQGVRMHAGSKLSIDIKETGQRYQAVVSKLNGRVDGVSQSIEIEATFQGKTLGLLPGMIGHVVLTDQKSKPN